MANESKHGARIALLPPNFLLVHQTILKGSNPGRHVIDSDESGKKIAVHVPIDDDAALGAAVRNAVQGKLRNR